jgi:hypothetical protein
MEMEKSKKGRKQEKKANKKADDKSKGEHKSDDEAQKQRAVVRQESGVLESESHDMIDAAFYVRLNRDIAEHFSRIEQGLHHINESHN